MSQPHQDHNAGNEDFETSAHGPNAGRQSGPGNIRTPSLALEKAFNQLTHNKYHPRLLAERMSKVGKGFPKGPDEEKAMEEAFVALATILKSKPKLRTDVATYVGARHLLHKPFKKWLQENGYGGMVIYLDLPGLRASL